MVPSVVLASVIFTVVASVDWAVGVPSVGVSVVALPLSIIIVLTVNGSSVGSDVTVFSVGSCVLSGLSGSMISSGSMIILGVSMSIMPGSPSQKPEPEPDPEPEPLPD